MSLVLFFFYFHHCYFINFVSVVLSRGSVCVCLCVYERDRERVCVLVLLPRGHLAVSGNIFGCFTTWGGEL